MWGKCRVFVLHFKSVVLLCFGATGFELRASHLLDRCSATWATSPVLFCFNYVFSSSCLHSGQSGWWSFYLRLLCSKYYRLASQYLNYWWSLTNFFQRRALNDGLPNLCFQSIWNYRSDPQHLFLLSKSWNESFYDLQG
jgi:hypothetical protein